MAELINITVSIVTIVLSALGGYALATFREAIKLKYKKDVSSWLDLAKFALTEGRDAVIELLPVVKGLFKKDIEDIKTILEHSKPIPQAPSRDHAELEAIKLQTQIQHDNLNELQIKLNKSEQFASAKGHKAEYDQYMRD